MLSANCNNSCTLSSLSNNSNCTIYNSHLAQASECIFIHADNEVGVVYEVILQ